MLGRSVRLAPSAYSEGPFPSRITTPGYAYDAAGNLTNDSIHAYTFDAENRIKTLDATLATYSYSGPLRVKKVLNSQGTFTRVYIFSGSKVIAEYVNGSLSREYIYLGNQLLYTVRVGETDTYHHFDHLSTRIETRTDGTAERGYAHFPFGETWYESGPDVPGAQKYKFTTYERDQESGLDQAMFRYYSPRIGRFMSADLVAGSIGDPQSLNRYTYARNDTTNRTDPTGLLFGCLLDGFDTPCSFIAGLLLAGAAGALPPGVDTVGFNLDIEGNPHAYYLTLSDEGFSFGYFGLSDRDVEALFLPTGFEGTRTPPGVAFLLVPREDCMVRDAQRGGSDRYITYDLYANRGGQLVRTTSYWIQENIQSNGKWPGGGAQWGIFQDHQQAFAREGLLRTPVEPSSGTQSFYISTTQPTQSNVPVQGAARAHIFATLPNGQSAVLPSLSLSKRSGLNYVNGRLAPDCPKGSRR